MKSKQIFYLILCSSMIGASTIASAQVLQNMNPFRNKEQKFKSAFTDEEIALIKTDINQLSSVKMKGRITGTEGEKKAAEYIASRFKQIGLQEVDKNYQRKFSYTDGQVVSGESILQIGKQILKVPYDGYPLSFSGIKAESNFVICGNNEANNIWILPAYKQANERLLSPAEKEKMLYNKAANAKERGAVAVIFYNNISEEAVLPFQYKGQLEPLDIPVYEITAAAHTQYLKSSKILTQVKLEPVIKPIVKEGWNVYGVINNYAKKTVIISANYDGYAQDLNQVNQVNQWQSANDNATGIAAILAIAKKLRTSRLNYNYIIIAYSGKNKHLIGSERFLNDKNVAKNHISYAIHFDKLGKINANNDIYISGVGTSKLFSSLFKDQSPFWKYKLFNKGKDESDFQNYYNLKIPYLNFSSGEDIDAGTAQDQSSKVRMAGMITIMDKAYQTITDLDQRVAEYTFVETEDVEEIINSVAIEQNAPLSVTEAAASMVSLGLTPDLQHAEEGVMVKQVAKGKPAAEAGIQAGDVIYQIRNFPVQNYDQYIDVLKKFQKGEKVYVKFKRKGMFLQKVVTFE